MPDSHWPQAGEVSFPSWHVELDGIVWSESGKPDEVSPGRLDIKFLSIKPWHQHSLQHRWHSLVPLVFEVLSRGH